MFAHGLGSGVELVKRMTKGDLRTFWVMFDHIKKVHGWTTIGAHAYYPFCHRLLTIVLCEMKVKDFGSQSLYWTSLNEHVMWVGLPKTNFHGFMDNVASELQCNS
jgi:hypothetical protein